MGNTSSVFCSPNFYVSRLSGNCKEGSHASWKIWKIIPSVFQGLAGAEKGYWSWKILEIGVEGHWILCKMLESVVDWLSICSNRATFITDHFWPTRTCLVNFFSSVVSVPYLQGCFKKLPSNYRPRSLPTWKMPLEKHAEVTEKVLEFLDWLEASVCRIAICCLPASSLQKISGCATAEKLAQNVDTVVSRVVFTAMNVANTCRCSNIVAKTVILINLLIYIMFGKKHPLTFSFIVGVGAQSTVGTRHFCLKIVLKINRIP